MGGVRGGFCQVLKLMLAGFGFDVSHQEIERILCEVEAWYATAHDQAGAEWLPIEGIRNFLFQDLGYEDVDEFEDALHGSFQDFLAAFPHIRVKEEEEKFLYRILPREPGPPRRMIFLVENSAQLVDTCFLKAEDAQVMIPSLGLTIGAENRRSIDSLYNHIANAQTNLRGPLQIAEMHSTRVAEVADTLGACLDVVEPYEIIVLDPCSLSEFMPDDNVRIEIVADIADLEACNLDSLSSMMTVPADDIGCETSPDFSTS